MESNNSAELLAAVLPKLSSTLRYTMGNIHFAASALAPAELREADPDLDAKASVLDQSYYQLLRLVNNLHAVAWLDSSDRIPPRDRDIVAIVREVFEKSRSLAALLGLELTFSCGEGAHICCVYRDSIEQLLFQLLSNAFKFTPRGGTVAIGVRAHSGQILLSVADTGCGIPPETLATLYERFLLAQELAHPHGLGLGLPFCRQIAEAHGGSIVVESKVGHGTKVILSIPDRQSGVAVTEDIPFDYAGGFNRTLLGLSDALPASAFRLKEQD